VPPADDQPLRSTEADVTASVDAVSGAAGGAPRAVGARLGRFVVVGELGRGGMGCAAAYDPELDHRWRSCWRPTPAAADAGASG
jgi:hypothetical protein